MIALNNSTKFKQSENTSNKVYITTEEKHGLLVHSDFYCCTISDVVICVNGQYHKNNVHFSEEELANYVAKYFINDQNITLQ